MGNTSNQGLDPMALARLVQAVNERPQWATSILKSLLGPFAPAPPEQPLTEEQSRMGVTYPAQFQPVADLAALLAGSTRTGVGKAVLGSERGALGEGKPPESVTAFHGTKEPFAEFDLSKIGQATGAENTALGFFLTDDYALAAERYAGRRGHVIESQVSLNNPRRLRDTTGFDIDPATALRKDASDYLGRNPESSEDWLEYRDYLVRQGHDGIVYTGPEQKIGASGRKEPGVRTFIVFDPKHIKVNQP